MRLPTSPLLARYLTEAPALFGYRDDTVKSYRKVLLQFERWLLAERLKSIETASTDDILDWVQHLRDDRSVSKTTLTPYLSALSSFFDLLIERKLRRGNPAHGLRVRGRTPVRPQNALSRGDLNALLSAPLLDRDPFVRRRDYFIIGLLASSGLRPSELARLRVCDIEFPEQRVLVKSGKGDKTAYAFLTKLAGPSFSADLEQFIADMGLHASRRVFYKLTPNVRPLTVRDLERVVTRHARAASLHRKYRVVSPSTLRHTFATVLKTEFNLQPIALREAMRHKSIETTMKYYHPTPLDVAKDLRMAGVLP